jgi:hypothetical protein
MGFELELEALFKNIFVSWMPAPIPPSFATHHHYSLPFPSTSLCPYKVAEQEEVKQA